MSEEEGQAFELFEWGGVEETVVMLKYVGVEGDGAAPPSFFLGSCFNFGVEGKGGKNLKEK